MHLHLYVQRSVFHFCSTMPVKITHNSKERHTIIKELFNNFIVRIQKSNTSVLRTYSTSSTPTVASFLPPLSYKGLKGGGMFSPMWGQPPPPHGGVTVLYPLRSRKHVSSLHFSISLNLAYYVQQFPRLVLYRQGRLTHIKTLSYL